MGDYGIDEWCYRMEEHKRKGHRINKYAEKYAENKVNDIINSHPKTIEVM